MKLTQPFRVGDVCDGAKAFTLVEIMVASVAAAIILVAIYGIFYRAIKMRDNATERSREARLKVRAMSVIRNDLRNAFISGGILASTLEGESNGTEGPGSTFPGYLKMTTTTGKDTAEETYGDVQQVEYYVTRDKTTSGTANGGTLVRVVTRDLLNETPTVIHEQQILSGVQSFQVSFYDGRNWQGSWQISGTSTTGSGTSSTTTTGTAAASTTETLPAAIRVDIQQEAPESTARTGRGPAPAPLEILVPWLTAPFLSGTNYIIGSGTGSSPGIQ